MENGFPHTEHWKNKNDNTEHWKNKNDNTNLKKQLQLILKRLFLNEYLGSIISFSPRELIFTSIIYWLSLKESLFFKDYTVFNYLLCVCRKDLSPLPVL